MSLSLSSSKTDFFKYLVEQIKKQKMNFFIGAGISKISPANLPLANEFRKYVLLQLCSSEGLNEIYRQSIKDLAQLPFESFINKLLTNSNYFHFHMSIFNSGKPNKSHLLIAQLMAKGLITELLTTNFDTLLEQAYRLHYSKAQFLTVLLKEQQFTQNNFEKIAKPLMFKIHGGVQDPQSIRTTLDLIANHGLKEKRINVLKHFFENPNKEILILGYSCSDNFDINPYLHRVKSKTQVLFVKHTTGDFRIEDLKDPLNSFLGYQICCNTAEIIDYLWKELIHTEYENENKEEDTWHNSIQKWSAELISAQRHYLIADLLLELRKTDLAISIFEKALRKKHEKRLRARILIRLATAYNLKGNYGKSRQNYIESLPILEEEENYLNIAEVYHFLGMIEKLTGNYSNAQEQLLKSKEIAEKIGYQMGIAIVTSELGTISQRKGDFTKAKQLYEKALAINYEIGHLVGIAVNLHHIGTIIRKEGFSDKAKELFTEELELRRKLGDRHGEAGCLHELGLCLIDTDPKSAQEVLEDAHELLTEIGDIARIAWTLNDLGTVALRLGDLIVAEKYTKQSISIKRSKNDQRGLAMSFGQLALITKAQGKQEDAKHLFNKSYEIAKKLGDKNTMEIVQRELSKLQK